MVPQGHPHRERVRRGRRVAARGRTEDHREVRGEDPPQTRGSPARLLVQAPRRVQPHGADLGGGTRQGSHLLIRGQPRAGRRPRRQATRVRRRDLYAGHHPGHQGGGGQAARGHRRAGGGELRRVPGVRQAKG